MPEHPTALLGTPMLRASCGTLGMKESNQEKVVQTLYKQNRDSTSPLSMRLYAVPQKFDSGLRHLVNVLQTLINQGFGAFFLVNFPKN